jgi:hypothetical protein
VHQAFQSLAKDHAGVFGAVGAAQEDVLTKVRMMALLGLGARAATLTFQDVQVRLYCSVSLYGGDLQKEGSLMWVPALLGWVRCRWPASKTQYVPQKLYGMCSPALNALTCGRLGKYGREQTSAEHCPISRPLCLKCTGMNG